MTVSLDQAIEWATTAASRLWSRQRPSIDRDDLEQEARVTVWSVYQSIDQTRSPGEIRRYIQKTVLNVLLQNMRRLDDDTIRGYDAVSPDSPIGVVLAAEQLRILFRVVDTVPMNRVAVVVQIATGDIRPTSAQYKVAQRASRRVQAAAAEAGYTLDKAAVWRLLILRVEAMS